MLNIVIGAACAFFICCIFTLIKKKKKKSGKGLKQYRKDFKFQIRDVIECDEKKKTKSKKKKKYIGLFIFEGDIKASSRHQLAKFVDEMIINKENLEEVVIGVESGGGSVAHYGHCMSEVERVRNAGIPLTVCIDTIAASGGYLMSAPANKILAAPYALVGSIGVVSFIPNFRKFLQKLNIEPRTFTAGTHKRTLTLTDDATKEDEDHYKEKLENIHQVFIETVTKYRPQINPDKVCTGDHWLAEDSMKKELGLIDEILPSSDYLLSRNREFAILEKREKESLGGKIKKIFTQASSLFKVEY